MTVLAGWQKKMGAGLGPALSRQAIAGPNGGRNEDIKLSLYA
jgi:hypothetical protein